MAVSLDFVSEPQVFLDAAAEFLAVRPVASTVVSTVTERIAREDAAGVARPGGFRWWWLVVREGDEVVGAAMRTAPFKPFPLYLLEMADDAAVELARTLHQRGEDVDGVNGALPGAALCAGEMAKLTGRRVRVLEHVRLFELGELVPPDRIPAGRLRLATEADLETALHWYAAFGMDAAEQAGRSEAHSGPVEDEDSMLRRIRDGRVFLWVDEAGVPVHVTGSNAPSFGVVRIGPVYTPKEHRGRGYAAAAVFEVSRAIQESGARACLFTDQANPTSNAIYQRLGYRAVEDQVNQVIEL